jgi:spoIIIJ-associated protein
MPEIEKSAESVEEAIEAALAELGVSEQEAQIGIIQEERSGFLGRKPQAAVVRVRTLGPASGPPLQPSDQEQETAITFVRGLLGTMGLEAAVDLAEVDGVTYVDVWGTDEGEDLGILIGRRGHTLDSIQELMRNFVLQQTGARCHVLLDVEDYRKRQRSRIAREAQEVARRVKRTGRSEALEPMGAFERKLVHDTVAQVGGLETASEGEEPQRRVVIKRGG